MFSYQDILKRDKNPIWARKKIYAYSKTHTIAQTAAHFGCHINTVKNIRKRAKNAEFSNRSKAPKQSPNAISEDIVKRILEVWEDKRMGARNLKHQYNLPVSESSVYRTLKRHHKVCLRKKKHVRKKDLRAIKQTYKMFQKMQFDGKVLDDIPEFFGPMVQHDLPVIQFSLVCEKSGASFISYAQGETSLAACTFIVYVLEHLKRWGIETKGMRIRTDWAKCYVGSSESFKKSRFHLLLASYGVRHQPICHKNQNADVERFHGLVEQYFYTLVKPNSKSDFYMKSNQVMTWFNLIRKNGGKDWKTPLNFLQEDLPGIDPQILSLAPIDLDKHPDLYHLKVHPDEFQFQSFKPRIDMLYDELSLSLVQDLLRACCPNKI